MSRLLAVLAILALPYNNFPFPHLEGSLMPLAAVFLGLFALAALTEFILRPQSPLPVNNMDRAYAAMLAVFYMVTLFGTASLLGQPPSLPVSPLRRFLEVNGFLVVQILAYLVGRRMGREWGVARFCSLLLLAFAPSLVIGAIQGLSGNAAWANVLRPWLTADSFVVQERGRIALLTAEPSWAALDLGAFVLPALMYSFIVTRKALYALAGALVVLLLYYTRSVLGVLLLGTLIAALILSYRRTAAYLAVGAMLIALVVIGVSQSSPTARVMRSVRGVLGNETIESIATRMFLHEVALGVFRAHPVAGVGLRNAGYFLDAHVRPEYLEFDLIRGYVESADRVLDSKSFLLEIAAGTGVLGLIAALLFFAAAVQKLRLIAVAAPRQAACLAAMVLLALVGSFSMNILWYPTFWVLWGVISGVRPDLGQTPANVS